MPEASHRTFTKLTVSVSYFMPIPQIRCHFESLSTRWTGLFEHFYISVLINVWSHVAGHNPSNTANRWVSVLYPTDSYAAQAISLVFQGRMQ